MNNFAELGISERTLTSLDMLGFHTPTEVQVKSIGLILRGEDVIASAQTGTGKTAAYALPLIEHLTAGAKRGRTIRGLVLVPTRELAIQVQTEFERLSRGAVRTAAFYGGTGYGAQLSLLRKGVEVAVATPGRLNDLIQRRLIDLSHVQYLVLDEADRMLDMGFAPQVQKVIDSLPTTRQTVMFSATLDDRVRKIAQKYMSQPVTVRCKHEQVEASSIDQQSYRVSKGGKDAFLLSMLGETLEGTVLVFTRTKRTASQVAKRLRAANVQAEEIHSNISQRQREKTIARYRAGMFNVLVATDIAARGLDVPSIAHVVNYDLPQCAEDYVHRIGRTGRAGRAGKAHSFISEDQSHLVRDIERLIGKNLETGKPLSAERHVSNARVFSNESRDRANKHNNGFRGRRAARVS